MFVEGDTTKAPNLTRHSKFLHGQLYEVDSSTSASENGLRVQP